MSAEQNALAAPVVLSVMLPAYQEEENLRLPIAPHPHHASIAGRGD